VWHVGWSHCGKFLTTCSEDKTIHVWSVGDETAPPVRLAVLDDAHSRTVRACEFSPDGELIASASFDGTVVIWEVGNSAKTSWDQIASLEGHESEVKSVAWNREGSLLATCGRDKRVWVWERLHESEFECVSVLEGHSQDVKFVTWHPRANVLYSGSYDDSVRVWREEADEWYCSETLSGHSSTVWGITTSPGGDRLCSCSADRSLALWSCPDPNTASAGGSSEHRRLHVLEDLHAQPVLAAHWNPATALVATCSQDNAVTISRVAGGTEDATLAVCCSVSDAHTNDVNCVRWNPVRHDLLASVGDDGLLKLWRFTV
jgi:cytosolic iron-sulfur protein assembly protein CIAO1